MDIKKFKVDNPFAELDGSLIELDHREQILTPNKNSYFFGFIPMVLGLPLLALALYKFLEDGIEKIKFPEKYIILALGVLFFLIGLVFVLKATVYLLTIKSFLRTAKYSKCNVKCKTIYSPESRRRPIAGPDAHYLRVDYVDDSGKQVTKIVQGVLATELYRKMHGYFIFEGDYKSLDNYLLVAYNSKGKIAIIYKFHILKDS